MDKIPLSNYEYETRILTALERIAAGVERTNQLLTEANEPKPLPQYTINHNWPSVDHLEPVVIRQAAKA